MDRSPIALPHSLTCTALLLAVPALCAQGDASTSDITFPNAQVQVLGQVDTHDGAHPHLAYPGTGVAFRFTGKSVTLRLNSSTDTGALSVVVNHSEPLLFVLEKGDQSIPIAADSTEGVRQVEVYKRTEVWQGTVTLDGITLPQGAQLQPPVPLPPRKLLFIGDSVTCGDGMNDNATCTADRQHPASNAYETYGMRLGRRLDAESRLVCYGGRGLERDYRGFEAKDNVLVIPQLIRLSMPTDDPKDREPWDPKLWQPDAVLVSLGTNDFNLQKTKPLNADRWVAEYVQFVHDLRDDYPKALLFLTEGSIVTDPLLRRYVQETVQKVGDPRVRYLASQHYPGHSCDGHPTEEQHFRIANDYEPALREALGW